MPGPRVLALDLSGRLGWACGVRGDVPAHGVVDLVARSGDARLEERLAGLADALADLIAVHSPDRVAMEAPLPPQAQTQMRTAEQQFGLAAVARLVAYRRGLPLRSVRADVARTAVLGRARFGGRDAAKEAAMEWCRRHGWQPRTDDAADALVLLAHEIGITVATPMPVAGAMG